jgi:hypothetical protein
MQAWTFLSAVVLGSLIASMRFPLQSTLGSTARLGVGQWAVATAGATFRFTLKRIAGEA